MRISDWSSDVCSSDLLGDAVSDAVAGLDQQDGEWFVDHRAQAVDVHAQRVGVGKLLAPDAGLKLLPGHHRGGGFHQRLQDLQRRGVELQQLAAAAHLQGVEVVLEIKIGRASCRERVCQYV